MEITRDLNWDDFVVNAVRDQHGAGRQMGEVDAGVGVERLDLLQLVARTLCVAFPAVLAEGFLNFRLREESLVVRRKAPFDVLEVALPLVEEAVAVLVFIPEEGRRVEVGQLGREQDVPGFLREAPPVITDPDALIAAGIPRCGRGIGVRTDCKKSGPATAGAQKEICANPPEANFGEVPVRKASLPGKSSPWPIPG